MPAGYDAAAFPAGVRSRIVEVGTGLAMHVLEAIRRCCGWKTAAVARPVALGNLLIEFLKRET